MTVVTGDGAQGHPYRALYDRVIATAAVRIVSFPTCGSPRPGEVIVTPMRTDFGGSVPLVRFTVDEHGTATGSAVGRVGFMAARNQRTSGLDPRSPHPEDRDVRWAIGTRVPPLCLGTSATHR